jgi:hypothetical protein
MPKRNQQIKGPVSQSMAVQILSNLHGTVILHYLIFWGLLQIIISRLHQTAWNRGRS